MIYYNTNLKRYTKVLKDNIDWYFENNFKISIITVTMNSEKFLEENIKSLSDQTHKNFEHIIIDGNSSDNTIEIIKKFR